jgi:hypothetical protein
MAAHDSSSAISSFVSFTDKALTFWLKFSSFVVPGMGHTFVSLVVNPGQRELRRRASFLGGHLTHMLKYGSVLGHVLRLESWETLGMHVLRYLLEKK